MPKFLVQARYTAEGMKGVLKDGGTGRVNSVEKAVSNLGGKVESFHFAFGDEDAIVIIDMPNNVAAAGLCTAIGATGAVSLKTTVLITPEEMDQAVEKAPRSDYRAPGH